MVLFFLNQMWNLFKWSKQKKNNLINGAGSLLIAIERENIKVTIKYGMNTQFDILFDNVSHKYSQIKC